MNSTKFFNFSVFLVILLLLWPILRLSVPSAGGADHRETKAVLLEVHDREVMARSSYEAYALKALEEDYPNIAYLFISLAVSESIHAANMRSLLAELGVAVFEEEPSVEVHKTKKNLKKAAEVELHEINKLYPEYVARITPENYRPAIEAITHSWQAEKQHREHIEKIKDTVNAFFRAVAKKIEATAHLYYVCGACGSTLREPPQGSCAICSGPAAQIHVVPETEPSL